MPLPEIPPLPPAPDDLYHYLRLLHDAGFAPVAGVDEAGRGPLAGAVVAAAAILPPGFVLPGLNDSKQLSAAQRETLAAQLQAQPGVVWALGECSPTEIDRLNILRATWLAMRRACLALPAPPALFVVDGLPVQGLPGPSLAIVKGDAKCAAIAAASILAKVHRDHQMEAADREFPQYGFAQHKGYGTAEHLEALRRHGPCPLHRRSFRPVADLLAPPPVQLSLGL